MSGLPDETCPNTLTNPMVKTVLITRMYATAMFTVVIWDWITTFPQEYELIWKSELSPIKVLFLLQRYYSLTVFAVPISLFDGDWTAKSCQKYHKLDAYLSIPILYMGSLILLIRCYAIWNRNKYIVGGGLVGLAIVFSLGYYGASTTAPLPVPPGMTAFACIAARGKNHGEWVDAIWLGPMIFDLITTVLTSVKVYLYQRQGTVSGILRTFWRDGVFYFLAISFANLLNSIFFLLPNKNIQAINTFFALCMTSILSQRLVLHLRSRKGAGTSSAAKSASYAQSGPTPTQARGVISALTEPGSTFDGAGRIPLDKYGGRSVAFDTTTERHFPAQFNPPSSPSFGPSSNTNTTEGLQVDEQYERNRHSKTGYLVDMGSHQWP